MEEEKRYKQEEGEERVPARTPGTHSPSETQKLCQMLHSKEPIAKGGARRRVQWALPAPYGGVLADQRHHLTRYVEKKEEETLLGR